MKKARNITKEERLQIVKECLERGRNYGEMALKYSVSYQQVRTWTLRFEELGEAGLEDRRGKCKKDQTPRTELEAEQIEIEQKCSIFMVTTKTQCGIVYMLLHNIVRCKHGLEY